MTTQPTPLPPTVADLFKNLHTADDVIEQLGFEMNHGYLSPKNRAIVEAAQDRVRALASRAADPEREAKVEALRETLRIIACAAPDRLDHSIDVARLERVSNLAAAAIAASNANARGGE